MKSLLPDVLKPGLDVVFCGKAAGSRSAESGVYYAGNGNRFWKILHRTGMIPQELERFSIIRGHIQQRRSNFRILLA